MDKEIDISIVTYNSLQWIDTFIDSLLNQNYPKDRINIYITDNDSKDLTYEKLVEVKKEHGNIFNNFEVSMGKNLGFGNGHNDNIFKSSAEFILVTNIDLLFDADAIMNVVHAASRDNLTVASWELRQKPFEHPKNYNPITFETSWSSSACILFRRSAIEQVGGYEKRIFMYEEDVELSFRLRDNGFILKYCPCAVCWHYSYEHENQIKPLQFLGSAIGNMYIRFRYGSFIEIIKGFLFYFVFMLLPQKFKGQRTGLLKNFVNLMWNMSYFLISRKKSSLKFNFIGKSYELMREGAFYSYIKPKANQNELISVIIRTYGDRNNFLKEAIASVYNQTYSNIEIVVIEDGTNNAEEYIQSLIGKNIKNIIYKSIPKGGRCKAGNMGLSLANGEYLIFLDDDDLFYPEHLEVLSNELSSNSNVSAVYSNAFEVATKIISKDPLEYLELGYDIIYKQAFSRPLIWCHNYIPIQTILFKRELYDKYGGFDEELENFEDWNLWTRYSLKHDFKYIPKTTSMYRVPANKDNLKSRQREFDCYYIKALEKQKELKITTSPDEIIHYCTEINKNMYLFQVSVENVKRILKRYSIFNNFYYYARKLYYNYK